jgi:hypothetical protein
VTEAPAADAAVDRAAGPRKAALVVVLAAGKILFLAAFLPAAHGCTANDVIVPAGAVLEPDLAFLLVPHIFGLVAAIAALLFWRRWQARMRALEITLVALALLGSLSLAAFFFFSVERLGGVALAALALALALSLLARAESSRWRAARALVVLGLDCTIWYFFWIVLFSMSDDSADAVLYGTWIAAGASVLLFASARRLESTVRRWRPRGP